MLSVFPSGLIVSFVSFQSHPPPMNVKESVFPSMKKVPCKLSGCMTKSVSVVILGKIFCGSWESRRGLVDALAKVPLRPVPLNVNVPVLGLFRVRQYSPPGRKLAKLSTATVSGDLA